MKLVRSPNLVAYWRGKDFLLEEFVRRRRAVAAPLYAQILDAFGKGRTSSSVSGSLSGYSPRSVHRAIRDLREWGFLVPSRSRRGRSVAKAWRHSFPAAYYHFATRDVSYLTDPVETAARLAKRVREEAQPCLFKEYEKATRRPLPIDLRTERTSLRKALWRRRTVRDFTAGAVSLRDLGSLLRGTWGQTGWIDGGELGPLLLKTSPSAGARHPIECYVLAWGVTGLHPGLYHFNVRRSALERLCTGDFRETAVEIAAGQDWIRSAAFLCVMTAIADRVFWKYQSADAYRLFFLDAGHLGQTFSLLATAAGLGPFTTAALKESAIERFLGIDGVREFPVYLCGAGVVRRPGKRLTSSPRRTSSLPESAGSMSASRGRY